jgi:hypothetical protein
MKKKVTQAMHLNTIKAICNKVIGNIRINRRNQKPFPLKVGKKQRYLLPLLFKII